MLNDALAYAIDNARQPIAFDLIEYAKRMKLQIAVTEYTLATLIFNTQFTIIEDLINKNTLLQVNTGNRSVKEMYSAKMLDYITKKSLTDPIRQPYALGLGKKKAIHDHIAIVSNDNGVDAADEIFR